jgi:hypothetical protein
VTDFSDYPNLCPACGYAKATFVSFRDAGDPLVTLIAFWPIEEIRHQAHEDRWVPRCQYFTACKHAHWDLQLIEHPDQAVLPPGIPVIGFDEPHRIDDLGGNEERSPLAPDHVIELANFPHPESATYIIGNTQYQRPSDHFVCESLIGITMDDPEVAADSTYYGSQIAAILWYDRKVKGL